MNLPAFNESSQNLRNTSQSLHDKPKFYKKIYNLVKIYSITSIYLDQLDNCVWSRAQVPVIGLSGQWNPYTNTSRGMCSPKHNSLLVHSGGPFSCLACSIWTPLTIPFYLLIEEKQLKGNKNVLFLHVLSNTCTGYRHLSS